MFEFLKKNFVKKENQIFFILFLCSFFLSFFIFLILTGQFTEFDNQSLISSILIADLLIILLLIGQTSLKVLRIFKNQEKKTTKSSKNLHTQITLLITIIALIPSLMVTLSSIIFFDQGIKNWFDEKVNVAISGSKIISESYFEEHRSNLKKDLVFLNNEINNEKIAFFTNRDRLTNLLRSLVIIKLIDEAVIFERSGQLLAKVGKSFLIDKEPPPPLWSLYRADDGEIPIFTNESKDKVRGIIRLDRVIPTYLYIGKTVDSLVLSRVESVNKAASQYLNLEKNIGKLQNLSYQLFFAINLLVILLSIWFGLLFANRITLPIKRIIVASEKISSGNLSTKIREFSNLNDFNKLAISLNKMVRILLNQKNKLFEAKELIDARRRFTETVIEGVSSGVIYIDLNFDVKLFNKRSTEILNQNLQDKNMGILLSEIPKIIQKMHTKAKLRMQNQIKINIKNSEKIININIVFEKKDKKIIGYIITFDDITDLIFAQKQAAWSNVARYLAHEIKNPLTPINLSAQRIQSNYKNNKLNLNIIENCTSTILRQVNDIKKLVTEFSEFARMPNSIFAKADILALINEHVRNLKIINKKIRFNINTPKKKILIFCDSSKINRLFNNLFKNSIESINEQKNKTINIDIKFHQNLIYIYFEDNGKGFPDNKDILFEPYITKKKGGTGLGLAICKKIVEEHNGEITLFSSKILGGAGVKIILPYGDS